MHHPSNLSSKAFKSVKQAITSLAIHIIAPKPAPISLRLEDLAQARDPLAQARARAVEQWLLRILAQASSFSPKRDYTSLKMKTSRLSDSLHRKAWASLC